MATNCILRLFLVPYVNNLADRLSRSLSLADSRLSICLWKRLQDAFGGSNGHSVDLMALPSNIMHSSTGAMLPFFSPHLSLVALALTCLVNLPTFTRRFCSLICTFSRRSASSPMCSVSYPSFPCHLSLWFRMSGLVVFGGPLFHIVLHLVYFLRERARWVFCIHPPRVAVKIPGLCLVIYGRFVSTLCKEVL